MVIFNSELCWSIHSLQINYSFFTIFKELDGSDGLEYPINNALLSCHKLVPVKFKHTQFADMFAELIYIGTDQQYLIYDK